MTLDTFDMRNAECTIGERQMHGCYNKDFLLANPHYRKPLLCPLPPLKHPT